MRANESAPTSVIEPCGVLLLNKPAGATSHDMVYRVRRLFNTRRVGHTGTLDPMATGVLVVLVGRAAKASEFVAHDKKGYRATLRLGLVTDTEDTTGHVLSTAPATGLPTDEQVREVCRRFTGEIKQIPPMYSALKVGGQKLCNLARKGQVIEREARPVTVYELSVKPATLPSDYVLSLACSGGTYVRTLCADIGAELGCGGVMASLERTETGGFPLEDCYTTEQLQNMTYEERLSCLLPVETLFANWDSVSLPTFYYNLCRNGCEIYQNRIGTAFPVGTRLRLCDEEGNFFATGEVLDFPEVGATAIKATRLFVLS